VGLVSEICRYSPALFVDGHQPEQYAESPLQPTSSSSAASYEIQQEESKVAIGWLGGAQKWRAIALPDTDACTQRIFGRQCTGRGKVEW